MTWSPKRTINGWYPKINPSGTHVLYGFWETHLVDLATEQEYEVTAPTGARLDPLDWITDRAFIAATEDGPAAVYSVSLDTLEPVLVPNAAPWGGAHSWGGAGHGHWGLYVQAPGNAQPYCVKDGRPFHPEIDQYKIAICGEHLVTADKARGYELQHFVGDTLVRRLPADAGWRVNAEGDVVTGYYGVVDCYPLGQGLVDATVTPWRREEPGCPVRVDGELWLWNGADESEDGLIMGRRVGEQDPIVLRAFPAVYVSAVWTGTIWIIAGNDDKGRLQVRRVRGDAPRERLVPAQPPPPPPPPPDEEPTPMNYRDGRRDILPYLAARWNELRIPDLTLALVERDVTDEETFKAVQIPAFLQIVGELHYEQGMMDVGLSTKRSGNNWQGYATDIITLKPINEQGTPIAGNFILVDALVSAGSADCVPTWSVLGPNTDASRPWAIPPTPAADAPPVPVPPDPVGATHQYIGGGNDTGTCDVCGRPRAAAVHATPASKGPHAYDGGEQDTGLCDVCGQALATPLHRWGPPTPAPTPPPAPAPAPSVGYNAFVHREAAEVAAAYEEAHGIPPAPSDLYHTAWRRLVEGMTHADILRGAKE